MPSEAAVEEAGITPEMMAKCHLHEGQRLRSLPEEAGIAADLGIFEMMMMTSKIRELAFQGASTQDIRKAAIAKGMTHAL